MNHFHAHIYFEPESIEAARALAKLAVLSGRFELVKIHDHPVGPHPSGMVEAHFGEPAYTVAHDWLVTHREIFSVLIHQDTGDDFKDHTQGILWLGRTLPLDFSFFELIQVRPELRIHSV